MLLIHITESVASFANWPLVNTEQKYCTRNTLSLPHCFSLIEMSPPVSNFDQQVDLEAFLREPHRTSVVRSELKKRIKSSALVIALAFVPTWLQPSKTRSDSQLSLNIALPTAYMTGIRGLVSVLVFIRHFLLPWQEHMDYGYGYRGYNGLLRLPYLRLLFAGPLVPMFFILSGYVLSKKTLRLSNSPEPSWEAIALSLAGSTFRRGLRLFLPPILSTFGVMLLLRAGLFSFPYDTMPGRVPEHPVISNTIVKQLIDWGYFITFEMANPWRWDSGDLVYGPHLWTIPISFKGSLVTFLMCLALLRVKSFVRLSIITMATVHAVLVGRWDMSLFLGGMLLSGLDVHQTAPSHIPYPVSLDTGRLTTIKASSLALLLFGGYIGSFPRYNHLGQCVTGYQTLCKLTTDYHYWHAIGAFFLILAIWRERSLQWLLNTPIAQYFGKISFSMYIIHEPFLHVFGFFTVPFFWSITGNGTYLQYQLGLVLGMGTTMVLLVWFADLFCRHVEDSCERIAVLVEKRSFST